METVKRDFLNNVIVKMSMYIEKDSLQTPPPPPTTTNKKNKNSSKQNKDKKEVNG